MPTRSRGSHANLGCGGERLQRRRRTPGTMKDAPPKPMKRTERVSSAEFGLDAPVIRKERGVVMVRPVTDLEGHPDIAELRQRYDLASSTPTGYIAEGLLLASAFLFDDLRPAYIALAMLLVQTLITPVLSPLALLWLLFERRLPKDRLGNLYFDRAGSRGAAAIASTMIIVGLVLIHVAGLPHLGLAGRSAHGHGGRRGRSRAAVEHSARSGAALAVRGGRGTGAAGGGVVAAAACFNSAAGLQRRRSMTPRDFDAALSQHERGE